MKLRWKTFESGVITRELPRDKLDKFFGIKPTVVQYRQFRAPVLQVSFDDATWHDVQHEPPIPYEEWTNE